MVDAPPQVDAKVDALISAPHQLKSSPLIGVEVAPVQEKRHSDATRQVDAIDAPVFTIAEAAELTGVTRQALHQKLSRAGVLRDRICTSGPNKGRPEKIVPYAELFRVYPAAEVEWNRRQAAAQAQVAEATAHQEAAQADAADVAALKDWQRSVMDARLALLHEIERIQQERQIGRETALTLFLADATEGRLAEPIQALVARANARKGQLGSRTLSRRSVYRWWQQASKGHAALAPQAKGFMEPRWARTLMKLYRQPQKPSLAQVVAELPHVLPEDISAPSYSQARRFLDKVGAVERQRGRMLDRELKTIKPCKRRDTAVLGAPLVCVTADGHTFDAEVAHPLTGRPFRPEITPILDLYTRRIVGVSVGLAESGFVVMEALRQCVVTQGIPALFYVDNGSGYKNHWTRGVMERIGCSMTHSIAYNSQARGCIEVLHKTVWINLCARRLKTFVGASMDREAKQIVFKATRKDANQLIPWHAFQEFAKATILAYNARPHKSLPWTQDERGHRVHQSPDQAWKVAVEAGWQPIQCAENLDELLPMVERKASRGEINLYGNRYFSRDLEEFHGEVLRVAFDPWDARKIWVRDREGRFLAEAQIDGNKTDYFPRPFIQTAIEQRQAAADARAAAARARRRDLPERATVIAEVTEDQRARAAAQIAELDLRYEDQEPAPLLSLTPSEGRPRYDNRKDYIVDVLGNPDAWPPEEVAEAQRMLAGDEHLQIWLHSDPSTTHLVPWLSAVNAN